LEHALALGAEAMATGHYARTASDASGKVRLLRAMDLSKDQSYVLHVLNQDQLRRALFPLGTYSSPTCGGCGNQPAQARR
jgi:tRNA-specific 2-thiouridylase